MLRHILRGETRTPAFLALNPNGRIPVLELEGGEHLAESNAILCLARARRGAAGTHPDHPGLITGVRGWHGRCRVASRRTSQRNHSGAGPGRPAMPGQPLQEDRPT